MTIKVKNQILKYFHNLKSFGYSYHDDIDIKSFDIKNQNLPNNMESLNKMAINCNLCDLSKSRKNVLFGYGNQNSKIMFIQDEPSSIEDELNSFYLGNSGDMLSKMIENVLNMKKEEVYITSLVKCKSLNGANNLNFDSCNDYLLKQIDIVNPKIIVALGEKVYSYLIKDSNFLQNRGKIIKFNQASFIAVHQPSFIIRNPSLKKEAYFDMLNIKNFLEELN